MRRLGFNLLFFVFLVVGLSLMVSAEDATETVYDESEVLPNQTAALISNPRPLASAPASQDAREAARPQASAPSPVTARISSREAHRFSTPSVMLALLCTLLC